jgi:hypothetical protein
MDTERYLLAKLVAEDVSFSGFDVVYSPAMNRWLFGPRHRPSEWKHPPYDCDIVDTRGCERAGSEMTAPVLFQTLKDYVGLQAAWEIAPTVH